MPTPGSDLAGSSGPSDVTLELRGITKRYAGLVANDRIDLKLRRGEIHALLGENGAGKTTLMSVLFGLVRADEGTISLNGDLVEIDSPRRALGLRIGMVHQHFMLVPTMTAAENVALGNAAGGPRAAHLAEVAEELTALARRYGLAVDADRRVEDMPVGARQRLEVLKLLLRDVNVLIFDEPTAVLTPDEWAQLRDVLRRLADEGRSIVLITHKLGEVFDVADRCTVLRHGAVVGTAAISETSREELVRWMVGRDLRPRRAREPSRGGAEALRVTDLRVDRGDGHEAVRGVTLSVRHGEVLGVAGVDGNGQAELVDALTGLREPVSGSIRIGDREFERLTPSEYVRCGGALIPEDRHRTGVALSLCVWENLVMSEIGQAPYTRRGWLDMRAIIERAKRAMAEFDVRASGVTARVSELSGGNQQKVVLAREFQRQPRLLIAAHPTRGLDVAAAEFVTERIEAHRAAGGATLLVSAELDEIMTLSDRIAVLAGGQVAGTLEGEDVSREAIGALMTGTA